MVRETRAKITDTREEALERNAGETRGIEREEEI